MKKITRFYYFILKCDVLAQVIVLLTYERVFVFALSYFRSLNPVLKLSVLV